MRLLLRFSLLGLLAGGLLLILAADANAGPVYYEKYKGATGYSTCKLSFSHGTVKESKYSNGTPKFEVTKQVTCCSSYTGGKYYDKYKLKWKRGSKGGCEEGAFTGTSSTLKSAAERLASKAKAYFASPQSTTQKCKKVVTCEKTIKLKLWKPKRGWDWPKNGKNACKCK